MAKKLETRLENLERQAKPAQRVYVLWTDEDRRRADAEATPDDIIINVEWCDVWPPHGDFVLADEDADGEDDTTGTPA